MVIFMYVTIDKKHIALSLIICTILACTIGFLYNNIFAAKGNWGLSFKENGNAPEGNATADFLKQYDAYYIGNTEEKKVYLTFDAGYENGYMPQILDALKKIIGKNVSYQITFDAELADKYQKEKKRELQKARRSLPETEESKIIDNLAQMQSSANLNLVVVTIKDSDDWNTHKSLYQYAFNHYTAYPVLKKKTFQVVGEKFYRSSGKLYIKNDVYLPLKNEIKGNLVGKVVLEKKKKVHNHEKVGYYAIYLDKKLLYQEDIYFQKKKTKISLGRSF